MIASARHPIALLIPCCLVAIPAIAVAEDAPPPDGRWRGDAGAALSASGGNTRNQSLQLDVELARETAADRIGLGAAVRYARGEVDGERTTTAKQFGAFAQYDWNLSPRWYAFGRLALDRDEIVDLDLRAAANAGLGWKWIDTAALRLKLSGGVGTTDERYAVPQTIDGVLDDHFRRVTLLLAVDAEQQVGDALKMTHRLEWLPTVSGDRSDRSRYSVDATVTINRTLSLNVGLRIEHVSQPPAGRKATDSILFTGLNWHIGS